jgi:nucleoside-diphosphate-sugar epimerase
MRIALTGASGFIGTYTARALHAAGHRVTALVRPTSKRGAIDRYCDRFVAGTHDDEALWPEFLRDAECVIHNSIDWPTGPAWTLDHHLRSNLVASIKLLEASAPRQFVYISSIAVHHDMRPRWNGVIDEDHPLSPANEYGALKAAVEAHLWSAYYSRGQHTCALRPCAVYGVDPNLERSHGFALIEKLRRGEPVTKPGGGKFVHVDDVAAAIVATIGTPDAAGKPYNLVDCYARWSDWARMACEEMGVTVPIDLSSPSQPKNMFQKDAANTLGVALDRGHNGIRAHVRELIAVMDRGSSRYDLSTAKAATPT